MNEGPASSATSLPAQPARICALVINSVSRDSRVLKQADSLAAAGHTVTIIGVRDQLNPSSHEVRDSGVTIVRVAWRAAAFRRMAIAIIAAAIPIAAGLMLLSLVLPYHRLAAFGGYLSDRLFLPLFLYAAALAVIWAALSRARRALRTAQRYYEIEHFEDADMRRASVARRVRASAAYSYRIFNWSRPIMAEVSALDPHIIHCHDAATLPIGTRLKKRLHCLLVYDAHEIYEEVAQNRAEMGAVYRSLQRRHIPLIDAFITINDSIADFYVQHYKPLPPPVIVKNAAIPVGPIHYDGRLHHAAGLPQEQRVLLYQGGFAPRRGLEVLIESASYLPADWSLVMMGWGTLEEELRVLAAAHHSHFGRSLPTVCFIPGAPQEQLPYWTAGGSVGVIPYEHAGLNHWFCTPNKLWEYPNAGVPMLVSPFPEMRKIVESYGVGWLLPDPLIPTGPAAILSNLSDAELEEARVACQRFMAEDNWHIYAARLQELYERLLTRAQDPAGKAPVRAATQS